jgi:DNA-binding response OmpR family regulator
MTYVLVVDDSEPSREAMTTGLIRQGFDARGVGSTALESGSLAALDAEVVLIDLMLVGGSGFELARRIRRDRPEARVVLTSDYHFTAQQLERVNCGAVGFVPRPCDFDELGEFLRGKLASSGRRTLCAPAEVD